MLPRISWDVLEGACNGDKGVLFRSVAPRRNAPSIEDSNEGKSMDYRYTSQCTAISQTCA